MELTDQKDFIKEEIIRQERLKISKAVFHHGATDISDVVFCLYNDVFLYLCICIVFLIIGGSACSI